MITRLDIRNFKSLKEVSLDCRRVNVFVGRPNTGKSNILEALGLVSWLGWCDSKPLSGFVRFKELPNLFYDNILDSPVAITAQTPEAQNITLALAGENFSIQVNDTEKAQLTLAGEVAQDKLSFRKLCTRWPNPVRFYRYTPLGNVKPTSELNALTPPDGGNLHNIIYTSRELRAWAADHFAAAGLEFVLRPQEKRIEVQKKQDGIAFAYPVETISDTLLRVLFFYVAIESNSGATLVFEEPEAHTSPYYTKFLGEHIADNQANQFFIATHNPYFLSAIWEKTPQDDLAVFHTTFKNNASHFTQLSAERVSELMDQDPLLSLDDADADP